MSPFCVILLGFFIVVIVVIITTKIYETICPSLVPRLVCIESDEKKYNVDVEN